MTEIQEHTCFKVLFCQFCYPLIFYRVWEQTSHSTVSKGNPQKGRRAINDLCLCSVCPHCRKANHNTAPKEDEQRTGRNHYGDTQSFSSNNEISRVRNKSAGYISTLKEKSTSPPTVPQGAPNFSPRATLYNLLSSLTSFFGPNHTPNFIPNYPKEILSS